MKRAALHESWRPRLRNLKFLGNGILFSGISLYGISLFWQFARKERCYSKGCCDLFPRIHITRKRLTGSLSMASPFQQIALKSEMVFQGVRDPFPSINIVEKIELHLCHIEYGVRSRPPLHESPIYAAKIGCAFRNGQLRTPYLPSQFLQKFCWKISISMKSQSKCSKE